jgi:hypothetical protein
MDLYTMHTSERSPGGSMWVIVTATEAQRLEKLATESGSNRLVKAEFADIHGHPVGTVEVDLDTMRLSQHEIAQ